MSLVNSIIELKDFRRPVVDIRNYLRAFNKFGFGEVVKANLKNLTLKQLIKGVAGTNLQWSFNVSPLLSDIRALSGAVTAAKKQLNQLRIGEGKILRSHYVRPLVESYKGSVQSYEQSPASYIDVAGGAPQTIVRSSTYDNPSFHATMAYAYTIRHSPGLDDETAALLDVLGVNSNPAILWNAIPWSFVVDWFVGVSQWLDRFKTSQLEPVTLIYDYCYSIHIKRLTTATCGFGTSGAQVTCQEDAYKRVRMVPDYWGLIKATGMNSREFLLAASLGLAKMR
jgi:hypothetical protein